MKIKTITCHDVYNHGASLQAYALQRYLCDQGHDVEIIDYKPDYLSRHYKLGLIANPRYDKPILRQLYIAAKMPGHFRSLRRRDLFDAFRTRYMKLTPQRYHHVSELRAAPPEADLYIAGSDQIWNTSFPNGKDAAFYLDFGEKQVRKASFAASFATETIPQNLQPQVKAWIEQLDYVSIRERESFRLLRELGIARGENVLDPVFLLPRSHWEEMAEQGRMQLKQPYALVYAFDRSPASADIVRNLKKQIPNLTIYELAARKLGFGINIDRNVGPLQFLYLIRNAQMVISNSFHASAFSLIFEKNFCVVNRLDHLNIRMQNLMNQLGLESRYVSQYHTELLQAPDFTLPRKLIQAQLKLSQDYLATITTAY